MKQETIEEAAEKYCLINNIPIDQMIIKHDRSCEFKTPVTMFIEGAKWQAERMYNEEDLISFYNFIENHQLRKYGDVWKRITNDSKDKPLNFESVDDQYIIDWFEQFKKK
jgi:hypothetical protein